MRISTYDLINNSSGWGYLDAPYITNDIYIRGDTSIEWTVVGTGKFAINLSDMMQQVFEANTAYHAISVYVNGILQKTDDSILEKTTDFGLILDLTDDNSVIELVFNSNLNKTGNLTYIKKLSSFLLVNSPEETTTTTISPDATAILEDEDSIKANGIRIASVDFDNICGPYALSLVPDTGEFHLVDGGSEVWFTGNRSTEVSYSITIQARNITGSVINSKTLEFSIQDCHSSNECQVAGDGGGNGGGGGEDNPDPNLNSPTDLSVTTGVCGTLNAQSDDIFVSIDFSWSGDADGFDFQVSRGNTFNLIELQHVGMIGNSVVGNLPINSLFFFRVRSKSATSTGYSEWSSSLMFRTDVYTDDCGGVLPPINPPQYLPVLCPDGTPPDGPLEPPTESPSPTPNPSPTPTDPTPPDGPGGCSGSGCGEDGDGDGPTGGPSYPNPLPPTYNPESPDCVGPGCGTGGGGGGGGGPGGPGGPGGEDPNNPEQPPTQPPPQVPSCFDGKVHGSFLSFANLGDDSVVVLVRWDNRATGCSDYLDSIGAEDLTKIAEVTVGAGVTTGIDLGFACPECVEVCVTGDEVPFKYEMITFTFNDEGEPENPTVAKETMEISQLSCSCDGLSISDIFPDESNNNGGVLSSLSISAIPVNQNSIHFALHREPAGNEGCFQFTEEQSEGTDKQRRTKLACYACDGRSFLEITNEIIACEVGFFERYKSTNGTHLVSFQDHWDMTKYTNEWAKKGWPDTTIDAWLIGGKPVRTGWSNENTICVTCCQVDQTPTGNPSLGTAVVGESQISQQSPTDPYNNVSCLSGATVDPNFNGNTGASGPDTENQTAISPCRAPFVTSTISDGLGSVASSLKTSESFLGFSRLTTQQQVDDIEAARILCNNTGCIIATNNDYSYLKTYTNVVNVCQRGVSENDLANYRLTGGGLSIEIENRQIGGLGCGFAMDRYYACGLRDIGPWPGTTVSQGAGDSDVWRESGFVWTRETIASDSRRVGASRYTVTVEQTPYSSGGGSPNPLP